MGKDYYSILQITRSAKDADIKQAYRKLSLNFHPIKNPGDRIAADKFAESAEAYDVLSDRECDIQHVAAYQINYTRSCSSTCVFCVFEARKKSIYDQFGEEGLKNGVPLDLNTWSDTYTFCGDPHKIFHEFFGGDNPFAGKPHTNHTHLALTWIFVSSYYYFHADFSVHAQLDRTENFGGLAGRGRKKQDPPIERDLMLSLEEVYHGCIKKMKISRRVMNDDGHTSSFKEKILTITVKRGWQPHTRITFEQEGDQGPNNIPADIVFVVKDKPHSLFRRDGVSLIYKQNIPLALALIGTTIHVPTLDGRVLDIPITDIVK